MLLKTETLVSISQSDGFCSACVPVSLLTILPLVRVRWKKREGEAGGVWGETSGFNYFVLVFKNGWLFVSEQNSARSQLCVPTYEI